MRSPRDVIVVGAGVIGCAVAYELAKRSVRVLLIDKSLPGRATSASARGLWPLGEAIGLGCGVIYHAAQAASSPANSVPEPLPDAFRDLLVTSNACFPRLSDELGELTGIDIEYAPGGGLIFVIFEPHEVALVDRVADSLPPGVQLQRLTPQDLVRLVPHVTRDVVGGARLLGEHQVNPMLLAEAYKRAAIRLGATFRHDTQVEALRREGKRVVGVEVAGELLHGEVVVNAAGAWAGRLAATVGLDLPVAPVRGQIVLTEPLRPTLAACLSTSACYMAQKAHGEVLIGSTTEHVGFDVGVTEEGIRTLCRGAVAALPMLEHVHVKRTWAGLRPGTPDELPILGPVPTLEGYVNATGGFRTGIVAAPVTARLVAQCVVGEPRAAALTPFLADRFVKAPRAESATASGLPS